MSDRKHPVRGTATESGAPGPHIAREQATIKAMICLYCQDHHGQDSELCYDCNELLVYALQRLAICPFQEQKPACNLCEVHCYSAAKREKVRQVMRYAGPRMLFRHPVLALRHLLDKRRSIPQLKTRPKN